MTLVYWNKLSLMKVLWSLAFMLFLCFVNIGHVFASCLFICYGLSLHARLRNIQRNIKCYWSSSDFFFIPGGGERMRECALPSSWRLRSFLNLGRVISYGKWLVKKLPSTNVTLLFSILPSWLIHCFFYSLVRSLFLKLRDDSPT